MRGSPDLLLPRHESVGLFTQLRAYPIAIHPNLFMADYLVHPDDEPVEVGVEVTFPGGGSRTPRSVPENPPYKNPPLSNGGPPTVTAAGHPDPAAPYTNDETRAVLTLIERRDQILRDDVAEILRDVSTRVEQALLRRQQELLESLRHIRPASESPT
jgi:hypothetical protein